MDYRGRKYYLIRIYDYWHIQGIINKLKRLPSRSRKIHLRESNYRTVYIELLISYTFDVEELFSKIKIDILQKHSVYFIEITKENENKYCHKTLKL